MSDKPLFGVIGGSGLYAMPDLQDVEKIEITTPFGAPSTPIITGTLEGARVAFLARHGDGHVFNPTEVNYRANIYAMKAAGVDRIVSVSACGSLREDYAPGDIVVPDQLFDFTKERKRSFFEGGLVAHVGVADPFCIDLSQSIFQAVRQTGARAHYGGSFITIEGPRFSTRAESNTFRAWDMSIIGMTTSPEAYLAREAELCYGVIAHVTDYDVWHDEPVSVEMVITSMNTNVTITHAQEAIRSLARTLGGPKSCTCESALATALITNPKKVPKKAIDNLGILVEKYF